MKKVIWKFPIRIGLDPFEVVMPADSTILNVGIQEGPVMWALVDPQSESVPRMFRVLATGEQVDGNVVTGEQYVGTFFTGPYVWHLFRS